MTDFERRRIGRTSVEVTVLGLGCATLGGSRVPVSRDTAEAIVGAAWMAGVRYVDTAPYYGVDQAERAVGDALREHPRDDWVLSTKVGRLLRPEPQPAVLSGRRHPLPFGVVYDYSYDAIMRSFEDSLQRLGLARIDILYVHDIGAYQHGAEAPAHMRTLRDSGYRALERLKGSGTIGAVGIGVNERQVLLEAMDWGDWDAFLLAGRYTLLEQGSIEDLLPKCVARGISIVVGGPFNPASSLGTTVGTMARRRRRSRPRRQRLAPSVTGTQCRWRPQRCSFRWRTRRSRPLSPDRAMSRNSKPT